MEKQDALLSTYTVALPSGTSVSLRLIFAHGEVYVNLQEFWTQLVCARTDLFVPPAFQYGTVAAQSPALFQEQMMLSTVQDLADSMARLTQGTVMWHDYLTDARVTLLQSTAEIISNLEPQGEEVSLYLTGTKLTNWDWY